MARSVPLFLGKTNKEQFDGVGIKSNKATYTRTAAHCRPSAVAATTTGVLRRKSPLTVVALCSETPPKPRVFVFYMRLWVRCRWAQVDGLQPLATQRTSPPSSPVTMGLHRHSSAVRPSSCRFGCPCATQVFGRCVFRERAMSHYSCSLAWTRGSPGNSGCRSRTAAGRAELWWVRERKHCASDCQCITSWEHSENCRIAVLHTL